MASTDVTIKVDGDLVGELVSRIREAVGNDLETQRLHLDAHDHEFDALREQVSALRDGLDAHSILIQVLEERLDHMQDRLDRQGAKIRHLEHLLDVHRTSIRSEGNI